MIFGIGIDIVKVSRMLKWVADEAMLCRFFNQAEMASGSNALYLAEHYAARFAAKEAFAKALGSGLAGFNLSDVFIEADSSGKPHLVTIGSAKAALDERCKGGRLFVSLSHEREYAVASVVIEV